MAVARPPRTALARALDWSCPSCAADLTWSCHEAIVRDADGSISLLVSCTRCGTTAFHEPGGTFRDTL